MNVELWNSVFQWGSVALIAITFVFGAGALWTGNRINQRQTERLLVLERDLASARTTLAEQQERAAKAEQELLALRKSLQPRILNSKEFVRFLKVPKAAKASAEILYKENDEEAHSLAIQIRRWLGPGTAGDGVGWRVLGLRPLLPSDGVLNDPSLPATTRVGFLANPGGVTLLVAVLPASGTSPFELTKDSPPVHWLFAALLEAGVAITTITQDPRLKPDVIRVVVGPK